MHVLSLGIIGGRRKSLLGTGNRGSNEADVNGEEEMQPYACWEDGGGCVWLFLLIVESSIDLGTMVATGLGDFLGASEGIVECGWMTETAITHGRRVR